MYVKYDIAVFAIHSSSIYQKSVGLGESMSVPVNREIFVADGGVVMVQRVSVNEEGEMDYAVAVLLVGIAELVVFHLVLEGRVVENPRQLLLDDILRVIIIVGGCVFSDNQMNVMRAVLYVEASSVANLYAVVVETGFVGADVALQSVESTRRWRYCDVLCDAVFAGAVGKIGVECYLIDSAVRVVVCGTAFRRLCAVAEIPAYAVHPLVQVVQNLFGGACRT